MNPVLILQHQGPEHQGYLGTWLKSKNIPFIVFNAEQTEFPSSIEPYSALAVMGGAMSANDKLYSNRQAEILILQAMYRDIPVIGHCLGGQLMSRALGGTVSKSYKPEIGWQPIEYVDNELTKLWFGSDPTNTVIHWHYETFSIPSEATLLASSKSCINQAFAIGKHLAMQFHIEIDVQKINSWVNDQDVNWQNAIIEYDSVQNKEQILEGIKHNLNKHQNTASHIYSNWIKNTIWANNLL